MSRREVPARIVVEADSWRRATVTRRHSGREPYEARGWASRVHGVPVVLCREPDGRWVCVEPVSGRPICGVGTEGATRGRALAHTRHLVALVGALEGREPEGWLRDRIAAWTGRGAP